MRFGFTCVALTALLGLAACGGGPSSQRQAEQNGGEAATSSLPADVKPLPGGVSTLAFGSCNRQNFKQPLWDEIRQENPDLWLWLGDNIYADTEDSLEMRRKYEQQLANEAYQRFLSEVPIVGIWDDHDYGVNDGGRSYPARKMSKALLMDFLGVPEGHPRRQREGAYGSYDFGKGKRKLKLILLDTRYFREPLVKNPGGETNYKTNNGSLLGEAQWAWLAQELQTDARLVIIASSIQVLSPDHRWEKWNNFPEARAQLLGMIARSGHNVLLLSGDRHYSEFSVLRQESLDYPLYDFTSSGLTHPWQGAMDEKNPLRKGPAINKFNYGLIEINWEAEPLSVRLQSKGKQRQLHHEEIVRFPG
jgi:alkaline phosphatase D